jgi:hypothetical protein
VVGTHTNCGIIFNRTQDVYNVTRPERGGSWVVPALIPATSTIPELPGTVTVRCAETFGWCTNDNEVTIRSFYFRSGSAVPGTGTLRFQMFMDYNTSQVVFTVGNLGIFKLRVGTGISNAGCCNVIIGSNHRPTAQFIY